LAVRRRQDCQAIATTASRANTKSRRISMIGALILLALAAPAKDADISALLLRKTQAFSDAGPLGDGKAMAALADPRLVFFNENGDRATRDDLASITPGPANGVTTRMSVTDWDCQVHGDVAVTSFIDNAARTDAAGKTTTFRYRSVETWRHQGADWAMIGSETVALSDDPTAIPVAAVDDYVGTYRADSGLTFTFARQGADLAATTGGQPLTVQKAEAPDMFFTPGAARAVKIFRRDASGRVTGFIYHRVGQDIVFSRVA
jgi:ketosteroid isomerase-like protein